MQHISLHISNGNIDGNFKLHDNFPTPECCTFLMFLFSRKFDHSWGNESLRKLLGNDTFHRHLYHISVVGNHLFFFSASDGELVGSEGGYRVRRGCYFLPLGL